MKEGKLYRLGEICDFQGGSQPPKQEWIKAPKEGYVRMLQIRDFTKSRDFVIEYVKCSNKLRYCNEDDILIGRYGASVGKILTGLSGAYNVAIIKTIPNEQVITKAYIRRFFEGKTFQDLLQKVCGQRTAQAGFSKEDIVDLPIFVPPLSEQQRIVSLLDAEFAKIDTLKANAERNLQNAKDLFQAALKKELEPKEGWNTKTLGDVCSIVNGGTPSTSVSSYWDGGVQWLTPKDMSGLTSKYVDKGERTISQKGVEHSSAKVLPAQSVILSSRAPIGYVAINIVPMATNQGCKGIIPMKEIQSEYLYYFLIKSNDLLNSLGTGATFKELSGGKLASITIPFPIRSEQQRIVMSLDSLNERCKTLQDNYTKTIALCNDLKQALLRKAFNGEI